MADHFHRRLQPYVLDQLLALDQHVMRIVGENSHQVLPVGA
jgi:hypothetical protein